MRSNTYTLFFAGMVCFVCSILLAGVVSTLRPLQELNLLVDRKKNVLKALSLFDPKTEKKAPQEIESLYAESVSETILNSDGVEVQGKSMADLASDPSLIPIYLRKDNGSFAIPVIGRGLWSTLKGYFALKADGHTVVGITFYEQGETPGLGAEIEQIWFTNNFIGKDILDANGNLVSITVVKGKASERPSKEQIHSVDGISGATITCRGVNELLKTGLDKYRPYLEKKWTQSSPQGI